VQYCRVQEEFSFLCIEYPPMALSSNSVAVYTVDYSNEIGDIILYVNFTVDNGKRLSYV
jgi:hypothetical protein